MSEIITNLQSWVSLLPTFSVTNLLEVVIIAFLVYEVLLWIMNTMAWTLLKGIIVILIFTLMSAILRLTTILWILERISTIAVITLIVIFQPELRKALEQLGSRNFVTGILNLDDDKTRTSLSRNDIEQIIKATMEMAKQKTGALMVIERNVLLKEIENTGIEINGLISSGLIINIFEKNTPLHDGAVMIRGNRIIAATCYLPLSENMNISKDLGTRHRAALGISEVSDSITIVVSEETGRITIAQDGQLKRMPDAEALRNALMTIIADEEEKTWAGRGMRKRIGAASRAVSSPWRKRTPANRPKEKGSPSKEAATWQRTDRDPKLRRKGTSRNRRP